MPAHAFDEREPAEQGVEQGRLAAPVRPDERDTIAPRDFEVERTKSERAALDHSVFEPDDDVAAARSRCQTEPQLPRFVRLLDALDVRGLPGKRLLHVFRLLLLPTLPVPALLPLLHTPCLLLNPLLLGDIALIAFDVTGVPARPLGLVLAPAARIFGGAVRPLVELDDLRHGTVEERAVMRHDHRCSVIFLQERLEAREPGEVEVVGRLVEQEDVEPAEQDRRKGSASRFPAGERAQRMLELCFQAELGSTPHRWLNHRRVFEAQRQLENTRLSIEEVAGAVGFGTAQTLRLHFRRVLRTSPNTYRRRFATIRARPARRTSRGKQL